ncbi:hypothetical protein QQ020_13205 [Fulvivirgaceae bacterium BMA12]|uniref:Uncharacterized protein n=1 Tax=Agaribacillus aureus TaxID=3051825 RepID=A0ABT8L9S5_9BACT|nr:hypothetical protein [Fulvivirgaceae bacterium BMA12]
MPSDTGNPEVFDMYRKRIYLKGKTFNEAFLKIDLNKPEQHRVCTSQSSREVKKPLLIGLL